MHMTTKALVLRQVDYKESDKILTLFTQEQGKLTASARGCRKKGSALAAPCQLLAWSEMVLYDYQGRWTVKEASTERLFQGVRDDLERLALGCYFAEVAELAWSTVLPAGERWGRASPCLSTSTRCGLWSISPMEIQSGSSPFR